VDGWFNMNTINKFFIDPWKRLLRDRAFVISMLFLAFCAIGFQVGIAKLDVYLIKKPLDLRLSMDEIDETKLAPYRVLDKQKIESEDVVAELGTTEYIKWVVMDPTVAENDPARVMVVFITYYREPDIVPHVPEVCGRGGGNLIESTKDCVIHVSNCGAAKDEVPVRVLEIASPDMNGSYKYGTVAYFFGVNGGFECNRNMVRLRVNSLTSQYGYFSKVEIDFAGNAKLKNDEALKAVEKLMQKFLPVLVAEHWPKWPPEEEAK
jgi:hypothetical protein